MNTDSQLRKDVENQRMAMHAVEYAGAQDLKLELKSIHKDLYLKAEVLVVIILNMDF